MSDGYLTLEHGHVKLSGRLIPGLFVSMEVAGDVRFDTAEADNLSGKKKTPMGWEDSAITLVLDLLTESQSTCYDKLTELNAVFKGMDNKSNPKVYDVVNPHLVARGVDQVVFSRLKSSESNEDDVIQVTLEFDEHNPPQIPPEIRNSAAGASGSAPAASADAVADATVTQDPDSAFMQGFNDGYGNSGGDNEV